MDVFSIKQNIINRVSGAFTLAEVLITLTIIGIIAAITIPILQENIQNNQFKQAAKEAFSKSSQVVQQMRQEEGGSLSNYINDSNYSFKNDFIKHFKTIKDCGLQACVRQEVESSSYKTLTGEKANTTLGGEGQFVTVDGMFYNIQNGLSWAGAIMIIVDVNGYEKLPNTYGKDVFFFEIVNDNLLPMGAQNTDFNAPYYCRKTADNEYQGAACMYYVMQGKDY